ncbi:DUF2726 domain-containing protein [Cupriavidus basilensis]
MLGLVFLSPLPSFFCRYLSRQVQAGVPPRAFALLADIRSCDRMRYGFYERLTAALKDTHVFPQVAMSAFVQHKGKSHAARNLFAQKYVDYLVCERKTMRPLYVIELDGASHGSARAQKRDRQKNDVLASAGIPVMRYTSKDVDLRTILSDYISVASPQPTQGIGPSAPMRVLFSL